MTKLVYSDWLISLALHGSLVAGVALLNQPSPPLATRPITEPIRWVDVQTMTSEPSASVHQKSVHQKEIDPTDHLQKPKAQKQPLEAVHQTSDMDTLAKPMAQKTQKPKKNTATNQVKNQTKNQTKNQMTNQETSTKQVMTATATVDKQSMDMSKNSVDEINIDTDTANVATNAQEIEQPKKDENKTELQSKTDKTTTDKTTTDKTTIDETKADKTKTDEAKNTQSAKNPKTDHVNQWKTRFIANVNRNKRYPSHARKAGIQGSALLSVHVMANGNIHCCDVKQSTGSSQLDKAALQAAQKAVNQSREPPQTNHAFGFDFYVDYILSD